MAVPASIIGSLVPLDIRVDDNLICVTEFIFFHSPDITPRAEILSDPQSFFPFGPGLKIICFS